MKKIFLLAITVVSALGAYAQEKQKDDTLKIKWKNSKIWIFDAEVKVPADTLKPVKRKLSKRDFVHWGGLDLGVSMLTTIDNKFQLSQELDTTDINNFLDLNYSKSMFISLNPIEQNFCLYKNYVILTTGLGVEWNSYNFKKNMTLNPDAPYLSTSTSSIAPDSIKYSKNKLKITYVKLPLILQLNSNNENPHRSFHFSGGVEFAYKVGSRTKQKYEINGYDVKSNRRDDYHIADFKYSGVFRVGYGDNLTLFVNYGLSELLEGNKGPDDMDLFPLTAGVSISF